MSNLNTEVNQLFSRRAARRPTARTWAKHLGLLAVTFCTVTVAGVMEPFGIVELFPKVDPNLDTIGFLLGLPFFYAQQIADTIVMLWTDANVRNFGLSFSLSLLFILTCHEMGHYVACRIYGVDATLPFFIPTPPLIGPAGTFGAFIKIVSPLPSRRATFDIGVAGPLAGFAALIPVALVGFLTLQPTATVSYALLPEGTIVFSRPLLLQLTAALCGIEAPAIMPANPFYAAAWLGLLVTALNLIPSGQLDGGHAVFAVFGERIHYWTGRVAFVVMVALAAAGFYFYNSPSGILFAVLLGIMMRIRHPHPLDSTPLDGKRQAVAALTLLVFILSFTPFPIQIR